MSADIGVVGLAVMGQNLILNMNDHGYVVCAYNRTVEKVDKFLANEAKGTKVIGARTALELCNNLKRPRRVMMMVKAGNGVDSLIEELSPYLERGDIIIDGGNSEYKHTIDRVRYVERRGVSYVGAGVSGGEEGARYGPSIMPGGNQAAWRHIKDIFQSISAKVDGLPCCDWIGEDGSGHFVKMVHNGIEYGDMQIICEAYHLLHEGLGLSHSEIGDVFDQWNKTELDSYLIEITRDIMRFNDKDGEPLLPKIMDSAGQKGTGKWTAEAALDLGMPLTLIGESVFARCLSTLKKERVKASEVLAGPKRKLANIQDKKQFIDQISKALYASKIVSYAQGFMLLRQAAIEYKWTLNYGSIALMWRGGCIIRSRFLAKIKEAFDKDYKLESLLLDKFFMGELDKAQDGWRHVVTQAVQAGIPTPCFSTALAFYDGYRTPYLPANLIQAQRDYFGAHTYELLEKPGEFIHTNWTGRGGNVSSSTYNA